MRSSTPTMWSRFRFSEAGPGRARYRAARRHHLRVERHLDDHRRERARHERHDVLIVVAQVVAPQEWVVDTPAVEARDAAFEVPGVAAEQIDLVLRLAAVLARQHAARGD